MIRHSDAPAGADPAENGSAPAGTGVTEDLRIAWHAAVALAKIEALRVRLKLRRALWLAVMGVIGAIAFTTLTVAASVALFGGLAGALAELIGRAWAGNLVAAVLFFAAVSITIRMLATRGKRQRLAAIARTVEGVHVRARAAARADAVRADGVSDGDGDASAAHPPPRQPTTGAGAAT
jgi:hypothetical protein